MSLVCLGNFSHDGKSFKKGEEYKGKDEKLLSKKKLIGKGKSKPGPKPKKTKEKTGSEE